LPLKPRKDYNELFGFKYDSVTHTPISGVSAEGKYRETNHFHLFYFIIGIDLLDHLLSFDYRIRPTAEEALGTILLEKHRLMLFSIFYLLFSSSIL
jgi:hypothetical protein